MQADLSLPLQAGYDVLGGYLSPVNDGYGKPGLLPAAHRLRMCELAADAAPAVMVDRRAPRSTTSVPCTPLCLGRLWIATCHCHWAVLLAAMGSAESGGKLQDSAC